MLSFALPQSQPSVVVLMSKGNNYGPALAALRCHHHHVVTVSPMGDGARKDADYLIEWDVIEHDLGSTMKSSKSVMASLGGPSKRPSASLSDTSPIAHSSVPDIHNIAQRASFHDVEPNRVPTVSGWRSGPSKSPADYVKNIPSNKLLHPLQAAKPLVMPPNSSVAPLHQASGFENARGDDTKPVSDPIVTPLMPQPIVAPTMAIPTQEAKETFAELIEAMQNLTTLEKPYTIQYSIRRALGLGSDERDDGTGLGRSRAIDCVEASRRYQLCRQANVESLEEYLDVAAAKGLIKFGAVKYANSEHRRISLNPLLR